MNEFAYVQEIAGQSVNEEDFVLVASRGGVDLYRHPVLGLVACGENVGDEGPATFDEDRIREWMDENEA